MGLQSTIGTSQPSARLFISAGEASGDAYGAALVEAVRSISPDLELRLEAVGGPLLRRAGADIVADSSSWGAIGIVKSFGVGARVILGGLWAKGRLLQGPPGLLVVIDFGFFNIRLAKVAKRAGWKVLYFVPPGSWRRDRQGADLPAITDVIVTPFSWSADLLNKMGANAHWFGHPIKSLAKQSPVRGDGGIGVAVLPGSRQHEIEQNLPAIAGAVQGLPVVEFAVAPTVGRGELEAKWKTLTGGRTDLFTEGDVFGVLSRARAAIVCSGTATLQAAVAECPMVVIYRLSKVMKLEGKLLGLDKKVKFVSLPNIFLDRPAVPELLGDFATPEAIRRCLDDLLEDSSARAAQLAAFEELGFMLGPDDCIERTAELIVGLLNPTEVSHEQARAPVGRQLGYLRREQEEEARRVQRESGTKDLWQVLVDLGMVGEREVAQAKAQELGYNFVDLERYKLDPAALASVPPDLCREHEVIPVKKDGMNLYVAMTDPKDVRALDAVRSASQCRVIPVVALRDAIRQALDREY